MLEAYLRLLDEGDKAEKEIDEEEKVESEKKKVGNEKEIEEAPKSQSLCKFGLSGCIRGLRFTFYGVHAF